MKYLTDFDSVKSFEINIFSVIFELHNYSTMFGKKPAFCQKALLVAILNMNYEVRPYQINSLSPNIIL